MCVLHYMCGAYCKDRIKNDHIRESLGVTDIQEKMREHQQRWFGHAMRQEKMDLRRVVQEIRVEGKCGRGRP